MPRHPAISRLGSALGVGVGVGKLDTPGNTFVPLISTGPAAERARTWSGCMLASLVGLTVGSFFLGVGVILFLVAVLRALQEETAVFHGNLSWIPYLIVAVLGVLVIVIAGLRIAAGPARRRLPVKDGK